jgi:hypothetical protein
VRQRDSEHRVGFGSPCDLLESTAGLPLVNRVMDVTPLAIGA